MGWNATIVGRSLPRPDSRDRAALRLVTATAAARRHLRRQRLVLLPYGFALPVEIGRGEIGQRAACHIHAAHGTRRQRQMLILRCAGGWGAARSVQTLMVQYIQN